MSRILPLLMVLLLVTGCFAGSEDSPAARIRWVEDLSEGLRLAKQTGKPAMLFFTADWCLPCQELKKYIFTDKRVAEASRRLINIYIDTDANFELLNIYQVRRIPTIFFLNPDGDIVGRFSSDPSASNFVKQMTAIADKHTR